MSLSEPPGTRPGDDVAATPLAAELAKALKVDLSTIEPAAGTGPITELDVREAVRAVAEAARTLEPAETIALARPGAAATAPLTVSAAAPAAGLVAAAERHPVAEDTDLVLHSVAATLGRHPRLNAHLVAGELRLFDQVNLGFSVLVHGVLTFPVLRGAERAGVAELSRERCRLAARARNGELQTWERAGGTFTVSDLGPLGVDTFTAAPVPAQVAILGLGRLAERPAVVAGTLTARSELPLSLTFDPRAVDGAAAARFLTDLGALLDDAELLCAGAEEA